MHSHRGMGKSGRVQRCTPAASLIHVYQSPVQLIVQLVGGLVAHSGLRWPAQGVVSLVLDPTASHR